MISYTSGIPVYIEDLRVTGRIIEVFEDVKVVYVVKLDEGFAAAEHCYAHPLH